MKPVLFFLAFSLCMSLVVSFFAEPDFRNQVMAELKRRGFLDSTEAGGAAATPDTLEEVVS